MDEAQRELTRRWLKKAANDLATARLIGGTSGAPLDIAIYHCQQAAEKAVKGYLISRDQPFAKTHEIAPLVLQAMAMENGFEAFLDAAHLLSPFAWRFRYPSELEPSEPTRDQVDEALQHAQAVYDFVLGLLPPETHP